MTAPHAPTGGRGSNRPAADLHDTLGDLGDEKVGMTADSVEAQRGERRRARLRVAVGLCGVLAVAFVVVVLVQRNRAPVAEGPKAVPEARAPAAPEAPQFAGLPDTAATTLTIGEPVHVPDAMRSTARDSVRPVPTIARAPRNDDGATRPGRPASEAFDAPIGGPAAPPLLPPVNPNGSSANGGSSAYGARPAISTPTTAERMAAAQDAFKISNDEAAASATPFATRRNAFAAPVRANVTPVGQGSSAIAAATNATITVTPGRTARAVITVATPSATSGEPIRARLVEPLTDRGVVVLPAGTEVIGKGTAFDDGTANPRLAIAFTTFVLPDGTVRHATAQAYSPEDQRVGLRVPLNQQIGRKLGKVAGNAGLTYALEALSPRPQPIQTGVSGSLGLVATDPAYEAKRQAYDETARTVRSEFNLVSPTGARVLFELPVDTPVLVVFGLP